MDGCYIKVRIHGGASEEMVVPPLPDEVGTGGAYHRVS